MILGAAAAGYPASGATATPDQDGNAGLLQAVDRGELARGDPRRGAIFLLENGREGLFQWEAGNFAEAVRNDRAQAVYVPSQTDVTAISGVWKRFAAEGIHIAWFGAKFDIASVSSIDQATDDSAAWEAAIDYLNFIGGGTLFLSHGASKVTREISIPHDGIRIVGTGTRKVYPGRFQVGQACPSTIVPVHGDRNTFRFIASRGGAGAFCAENFNLATLESGQRPQAAFGWEAQSAFMYGFTFVRLGIHGFASAFDCYKGEGSEHAVGAVLINDCVINRNNWIARNLKATQFNGFRFTNNKAGQNGYQRGNGGIAVSGHDVAIENNILEGMRDPVFVVGGYRDVTVRGNYFEGNVGTACVQLRDIAGPYLVGPNNYALLDYSKIDHKVLLKFCGLGSCTDPYWPYVVHKMPAPLTGGVPANQLKNDVSTTEYGFCRLDRLDGANWSTPPRSIQRATVIPGNVERDVNPQTGHAMPVQEYRTSGSGSAVYRLAITGSAGQWVVLSWLFKRQPDGQAHADPYISMKMNEGASGGSRDYVAFGFSQAWRDGDWSLMTAAIRLEASMTSMLLLLYPHGSKPAEGRITRYLPPALYTVADIGNAVPYIDNQRARMIAKPPMTGRWDAGDTLYNSAPAAGATMFVCIKGGSPGSWITT